MKIKLLTSLANPWHAWSPGDVDEFDDADAQRLIEAGFGEATEQPVTVARGEPEVAPAATAAPEQVETTADPMADVETAAGAASKAARK